MTAFYSVGMYCQYVNIIMLTVSYIPLAYVAYDVDGIWINKRKYQQCRRRMHRDGQKRNMMQCIIKRWGAKYKPRRPSEYASMLPSVVRPLAHLFCALYVSRYDAITEMGRIISIYRHVLSQGFSAVLGRV